MNKLVFSGYCLLFAAILLTGCPKDPTTPDNPEELEEWPEGQNVYVAGFEKIQDNSVARLWKNGAMENLTGSGGSTVRSTNVISSEALSVFVKGNDVYVAGYDVILSDGEMIGRARLWKNGAEQQLENGTLTEQAFSVFVSGNDVYVLGREALDPIPLSKRWVFKIWKNGKAEIFAEGTHECQVNSIFVSGGNVYIVGCGIKSVSYNSIITAKLWINGKEENLTGSTNNSCAHSVFVSGSDVYVAGWDYNEPGHFSVAKYWMNGKVVNLTDGTKNAQAYSVYVSGSDIYVAGHEDFKAKLWKNGTTQDIADANAARALLSIFILGKDVYTAGYVEALQEVEPGSGVIPFSYLQATLWRNGKKLKLNTSGKYNNSRALSVFVSI